METGKRKVGIIGAGAVGATYAFALLQSGLAREIILLDVNRERAEGEAMDLRHGLPLALPARIRAGDYPDIADADLVVITAGVAQKPGETRLELVHRNAEIFEAICSQLSSLNPEGILLIVTNPVDVMTELTLRFTGLPSRRVIGSGTVLDSARFRYVLGRTFQVDPRNVHAYVVGEHGDSEVLLWSLATIAGVPVEKYAAGRKSDFSPEAITTEVKRAAYEVIQRKGATSAAVALAMLRISEAILRDQNSILCVSSHLENYLGLSDVCLSVPCIVNRQGVREWVEIAPSEAECRALARSAGVLQEILEQVAAA